MYIIFWIGRNNIESIGGVFRIVQNDLILCIPIILWYYFSTNFVEIFNINKE